MDTPDTWEASATASRWPTPFATDDLDWQDWQDWQAHIRTTALATTKPTRDMTADIHTGQECAQ